MPLYLREGDIALAACDATDPESQLILEKPAELDLGGIKTESGLVRRTILPTGTRVLSENMPGARSVSVGVWVPRGSRHETDEAQGATHYLEHLLFKGTTKRSAFDIAQAFDEVGGDSNAMTNKEHTHYYARVLAGDLPMALDVLMDMVMAPTLDEESFQVERNVILDELAMDLDNPTERTHEAFSSQIFPADPLGREVGGNAQVVSTIALEEIHEHYQAGYTPDQIVVTVAGAVNHDALCELVKQYLSRSNTPWPAWKETKTQAARNYFSAQPRKVNIATQSVVHKVSLPLEQTHLIVGMPASCSTHPDQSVLAILKTVLGGGMSSILFQNIREQRGLAYTTYAFGSSYFEAGTFGMYAACAKENAGQVVELMYQSLQDIAGGNISDEAIERAKTQMRGAHILALEDAGVRMRRLGMSEVAFGRYTPLPISLSYYNQVSASDLSGVCTQLLAGPKIEVHLGDIQ